MVDSPKKPFSFHGVFRSFEFAIGCVLAVFLIAGYFLVKSILHQPDYLREVVWEDQFDEANFDYNFRTPFERYEVDLSLWQPVEDRLKATHVSAVRQTIRRTVIRNEGQDEYLMSLHTSGLKPDFVCLSHPFGFTKDYGLEKPAGAENLSRYTARIDISEDPIGEPFVIELVIFSWNAFQGRKNQMFGVYARPQAEEVVIHLKLPNEIDNYKLQFERFDSAQSMMRFLDREQVNFTQVSPDTFEVKLEKPKNGDGYFVRWLD